MKRVIWTGPVFVGRLAEKVETALSVKVLVGTERIYFNDSAIDIRESNQQLREKLKDHFGTTFGLC